MRFIFQNYLLASCKTGSSWYLHECPVRFCIAEFLTTLVSHDCKFQDSIKTVSASEGFFTHFLHIPLINCLHCNYFIQKRKSSCTSISIEPKYFFSLEVRGGRQQEENVEWKNRVKRFGFFIWKMLTLLLNPTQYVHFRYTSCQMSKQRLFQFAPMLWVCGCLKFGNRPAVSVYVWALCFLPLCFESIILAAFINL